MFEALGMIVMNRGSAPTFVGHSGQSVVDVMAASEDLAASLRSWEVVDDATASDHRAIVATFSEATGREEPRPPLPPTWKWTEDRDEDLRRELEDRLRTLEDVSAEAVTAVLREASRTALKPASRRGRPPVFWWTHEVAEARRECMRARRAVLRARGDATRREERERHRTAKRELRRTIRAAKAQAFDRLVDDIENDPWGKGYKNVTDKIANLKMNLRLDVNSGLEDLSEEILL